MVNPGVLSTRLNTRLFRKHPPIHRIDKSYRDYWRAHTKKYRHILQKAHSEANECESILPYRASLYDSV